MKPSHPLLQGGWDPFTFDQQCDSPIATLLSVKLADTFAFSKSIYAIVYNSRCLEALKTMADVGFRRENPPWISIVLSR
jgi:hypothetical protein